MSSIRPLAVMPFTRRSSARFSRENQSIEHSSSRTAQGASLAGTSAVRVVHDVPKSMRSLRVALIQQSAIEAQRVCQAERADGAVAPVDDGWTIDALSAACSAAAI